MITKHLLALRADCKIWKGELHPHTHQPVDDQGNYILFGYRRCGLLDCINPDHHTLNIRHGRTPNGNKPKPLFKTKPTITGEQLHRIAKPLRRYTEPTECQVPGCHKPHRATNLCAAHSSQYSKWRKANGIGRIRQNYADGLPTELRPAKKHLTVKEAAHCEATGCDRRNHARGLCRLHYNRWLRINGATW